MKYAHTRAEKSAGDVLVQWQADDAAGEDGGGGVGGRIGPGAAGSTERTPVRPSCGGARRQPAWERQARNANTKKDAVTWRQRQLAIAGAQLGIEVVRRRPEVNIEDRWERPRFSQELAVVSGPANNDSSKDKVVGPRMRDDVEVL